MPKQPKAAQEAPKPVAAPGQVEVETVETAAPAEAPAEAPVEVADEPTRQADVDNQPPAAPSGPTVKARVLVGCSLGRCGDVVEVPADQVEALAGVVDTDPAAVAYAESLKSE